MSPGTSGSIDVATLMTVRKPHMPKKIQCSGRHSSFWTRATNRSRSALLLVPCTHQGSTYFQESWMVSQRGCSLPAIGATGCSPTPVHASRTCSHVCVVTWWSMMLMTPPSFPCPVSLPFPCFSMSTRYLTTRVVRLLRS